MKTPLVIITLVLCLAASGCTHLPREAKQQLAQASHRYESIQRGMTRSEVAVALGAPQLQGAEGHLRWEERYSPGNFEALEVGFDSSGKVESVKQISTRSRGFPGYDIATKSSDGPTGIYHDYDYGLDGTIAPYPPARLK